MAEIQVSRVAEGCTFHDAIAIPDDVFPNMVNHVEIIICTGAQAGKVTYAGEASLARSIYPQVMAELDEAVLVAASRAQEQSIQWSDIDSLIEV